MCNQVLLNKIGQWVQIHVDKNIDVYFLFIMQFTLSHTNLLIFCIIYKMYYHSSKIQ